MPNQEPKISIVLPVYNGSKYLRTAIDSCLAQTHRNLELIIVDDCSTDQTPDIVKSYSDPRIKYIRNQTNQRLPNSLNIGFKQAEGDYLTWTSDDNQYLPAALEEMLRYLKQHPDVDFVYSDMEVVNLAMGVHQFKACTHWTFYFENLIGASYLYTRKVYETVGDYDPNFEWIEDYDYWLRVEKRFTMRRLPKVLYLYGDHPQSLTSLKLYSIDLLAHLLRFHHGYLTFDGLVDGVGKYILKFPPFKKDSQNIWRPVLQKVSRMNAGLKQAFHGAIASALFKKVGTAATLIQKKAVKLFHKDRDFAEILSSLKQGDPQKKQVLCVIPFLTMGGSEKVMQDVVRGLNPKGYDFHLFCFNQDANPWVKKFLSYFVNFIGIPPVYDVEPYAEHLGKVIQKLNIDMILVTNAHMVYKTAQRIKELFPTIKIVDIIHLERVGGTHQHISTIGAPFIDRRVCISRHLMDYMKAQYDPWGIPETLKERLLAIHNGTDLTEFSREKFTAGEFRKKYSIAPEEKIIAFVARMADEKNPFIFVDMARGLIAKNPNARLKFVMAGDGPLLGNVQAKVKDYGLEEHFVLPGALTNVGELLRDAFVFVVVSTHEGIPLSIQEAMLMNVPVVSTRVGAIHEIIQDGVSGFLIERNGRVVDEAAAKVQFLLDNPQAHSTMMERAKESAYPEFALETMCARYETVFKEVLN